MVSYWSGGTRLHRVCSVQNGRRPYCPGELVSMQMRYASVRGPTRRTDGWTRRYEVSLPLYFNSLVAVFSLVPSLSVFLPRQSRATLRSFFTGKIRYVLSFSLFLSIISAPLRFLGPPPPFLSLFLPVVDNSASHLVSLSRIPVFRAYVLFFFFFSIFRISLFYFRLHFSTALLFLPSSSCRSFRVLHILLAWHNIFLPLRLSSLFVVQSFVAHCYQLTPTLGSPFNVPTLFQKAAPVSAFCSRVSRTRKEERDGG